VETAHTLQVIVLPSCRLASASPSCPAAACRGPTPLVAGHGTVEGGNAPRELLATRPAAEARPHRAVGARAWRQHQCRTPPGLHGSLRLASGVWQALPGAGHAPTRGAPRRWLLTTDPCPYTDAPHCGIVVPTHASPLAQRLQRASRGRGGPCGSPRGTRRPEEPCLAWCTGAARTLSVTRRTA
jgi:hypothetical protein